MIRARRGRAAVTALSGVLLVSSLIWQSAGPASAVPVNDVHDGITYTADDADVAAGATATGYSGPGGAITIPDTVEIDGVVYDVVRVHHYAFSSEGITSVTLGEHVTSIGTGAFQGNDISTVSLPAGLASIESWGFADNAITAIDLPPGVVLDSNAFLDNQIASLVLPAGFDFPPVAGAAVGQFENNQLTSLTIPDSVTYIPHYAFRNNNLTDVVIPSSVTRIREQAFDLNPLETVDFLGDAPLLDGSGDWIPGAEVSYLCRYDVANGGGFSSPTWDDGDEVHNSNARPVTISFENQHGTDTTQVVDCNSAVAQPADPVADGFEFAGWTIDGDGFSFDDLVASDDLTIVAQWEPAVGGPADDLPDGDSKRDDTSGGAATPGISSTSTLPAVGAGPNAAIAGLAGLAFVLAGALLLARARLRRAC